MKKNWIWRSASIAALTFAAGCSSPELVDAPPPAEVAPPPPPAAYVSPPATSSRIETTELLGGPAPVAPPQVVTMKPIANPESMSAAERAPVYGARKPRRSTTRPSVVTSSRPVPNPALATAPGPVSRPSLATKPVLPKAVLPKPAAPVIAAAPKAATAAAKPAAPAARPAPAVAAAKPAAPVRETPKPVNPALAAQTKPAATPAPKAAATPAAKTPETKVAAKPKTKPEQLGLAVAADVTGASTLVLPPELAEGKQGVVSLTLAPTLSDRITAEAARLGLTREARTADARATLSGEGYTVIPSASQSARLKPGEATTFNWQVTPVEGGAKGPLKAAVSGDLKGGARPQPFAIAALEETPAAPPVAEKKGFDFSSLAKMFNPKADTAPAAAPADPVAATSLEAPAASGGFLDKLSLPGMSSINMPGVGAVKSGLVVLGALGFLALAILMALVNRASSRRRAAERRRKFRTMTEFQGEAETYREPAPVHHEPVYHAPAPAPVPEPVPVHTTPPPRTAPTIAVAEPAGA